MKRLLLNVLYAANILLVFLTIFLPFTYLIGNEVYYDFFISDIGSTIRGILSIMVFSLWIYCIFLWSKFDKKPLRLLLIVFLNAFFIIFYYRKAIKEGWLE